MLYFFPSTWHVIFTSYHRDTVLFVLYYYYFSLKKMYDIIIRLYRHNPNCETNPLDKERFLTTFFSNLTFLVPVSQLLGFIENT